VKDDVTVRGNLIKLSSKPTTRFSLVAAWWLFVSSRSCYSQEEICSPYQSKNRWYMIT